MLKRLRIRTKLAMVMALPIAVIVVGAGAGVVQALRVTTLAENAVEGANSSTGPLPIILLLQAERAATHGALGGSPEAAQMLAEVRRQADEFVDVTVAGVATATRESREAYAPAIEYYFGQVADLRQRVDEGIATQEQAWRVYTEQISIGMVGFSTTNASIESPDLRAELELLELVGRIREGQSSMLRILEPAIAAGRPADTFEKTVLLDGRGQLASWTGLYRAAVGLEGPVDAQLTSDEFALIDETLALLLDDAPSTAAAPLLSMLESRLAATDEAIGAQVSQVTATGEALVSRAKDEQRMLIFGASVAVLLAVFLIAVVNSAISKPLLRLAREAEDMAAHRLPDAVSRVLATPLGEDVIVPDVAAVRVDSRDEISEVASALNDVRRSALDLAVEQAVLRRNIADSFVNLGRRTQGLVARQLEFITELETNEADPQALGNLFELDHLATRMRRNAESLLILAGVEPARKWSSPVAIADVVRGALSEVEDYRRVRLERIDPVAIAGGAVADLSHLIAELVDNGLRYSPPEEVVVIEGRRRPSGFELAIVDRGIGMSRSDLVRANRRLAGEESFTVAPSRYLGHFVAGRLAQRLGAQVMLAQRSSGGIVVNVALPSTVVTELVRPEASTQTGPPSRSTEVTVAPEPAAHVEVGNEAQGAVTVSGEAGRTSSGLVRRRRGAQLPDTGPSSATRERSSRDAKAVGDMLSSYTSAVRRGRSRDGSADAPPRGPRNGGRP